MSYLSRRSREIKNEEQRRNGKWVAGIDFGYDASSVVIVPEWLPKAKAMMMVDRDMNKIRNKLFEQYETTQRARNPHMRENINWRGRGG